MEASIVVAAHNEGDLLWRTVQSCRETTDPLDCEIVVADDCSTDDSIEELRMRFPDVKVVSFPERRGVSPTKDLAARESRGDVLVFLDGHCKPEVGAILRLIDDVRESDGQTVFAPRVPALDVETWRNNSRVIGYGYLVELRDFKGRWLPRPELERRGNYHILPFFVGCCVAVSRDLYNKLHGFDPDMLQWGSEDIDFGLKAWLMGHEILNDPFATIGHRFRGKFSYEVAEEHPLVNQLRTARKNFTDAVWDDWIARFRQERSEGLWDAVWARYREREESVERERAYLMERRRRDEFWYAQRFGLQWPQRPAN